MEKIQEVMLPKRKKTINANNNKNGDNGNKLMMKTKLKNGKINVKTQKINATTISAKSIKSKSINREENDDDNNEMNNNKDNENKLIENDQLTSDNNDNQNSKNNNENSNNSSSSCSDINVNDNITTCPEAINHINDNYNGNEMNRREKLFKSLPKFIFKINGSQTLWNDLIIDLKTNENRMKFFQLISTLNSNEKYQLANIIIGDNHYDCIDSILKDWNNILNKISIDETNDINDKINDNHELPKINKRIFIDCAIQTDFGA